MVFGDGFYDTDFIKIHRFWFKTSVNIYFLKVNDIIITRDMEKKVTRKNVAPRAHNSLRSGPAQSYLDCPV